MHLVARDLSLSLSDKNFDKFANMYSSMYSLGATISNKIFLNNLLVLRCTVNRVRLSSKWSANIFDNMSTKDETTIDFEKMGSLYQDLQAKSIEKLPELKKSGFSSEMISTERKWSTLSPNLKPATNLYLFKKELKQSLLTQLP